MRSYSSEVINFQLPTWKGFLELEFKLGSIKNIQGFRFTASKLPAHFNCSIAYPLEIPTPNRTCLI